MGSINLLFDFVCVIQGIDIFEKYLGVLFHLRSRFGAIHVFADIYIVVSGVQLQTLDEALEVSSVPVIETFAFKHLLLDLHLRGEVYLHFSLDVSAEFGVQFKFDQCLESLWVGEESEVLHLGQFLLLGFV